MTEVQKPSVVYEGIQVTIFLSKNRQVGLHTKHIDISHHFLRDMVENKDINIQYILIEDNPAEIMTKKNPGVNFVNHMKRIT